MELFWGLWLVPLAVLIYRSGFVPRLIGVWIAINAFAYVVISMTGLVAPHMLPLINNLAVPALLGELVLALWLLIMGARHEA